MSRDLGRDVPDLEKLYARKLWADFSYPKMAILKVILNLLRLFLKNTLKGFLGKGRRCLRRWPGSIYLYIQGVNLEKPHFGIGGAIFVILQFLGCFVSCELAP